MRSHLERPGSPEPGKRNSPQSRAAGLHHLLALQHDIGNRGVSKLVLQRDATRTDQRPPGQSAASLMEPLWTRLLDYTDRETTLLTATASDITEFLDNYDKAYARFAALLAVMEKQAAAEAAAADKWTGLLQGVIVGTGVGLAAGALYEAATLAGKVAYEALGEIAEAGVGAGVDAGRGAINDAVAKAGPDFKPPPDLNNDKVARGLLSQLSQAWQAHAIMQQSVIAFTRVRDKVLDAARSGKPDPPNIVAVRPRLTALARALSRTEAALRNFDAAVNTPALRGTARGLEGDIWIKWLSEGNNSDAIHRQVLIARLTELGVFPRLGDRLGWSTSDTSPVRDAARAERVRLGNVGRVAVVIMPPRHNATLSEPSVPGIAMVRHDAYAVTGRPDPNPGGPVDRVRIAWTPGMFLRTGEVVRFTGTRSSGMITERLGPVLGVSQTERQAALADLGDLGRVQGAEAVELLGNLAFYATTQASESLPFGPGKDGVMQHQQFGREGFEDGILVRDPSGRTIVLLTPYISWGAARSAGDRHGVRRVLAIVTQPGPQQEAFDSQDVRVMLTPSAADVAQEIVTVHAAIGALGAR